MKTIKHCDRKKSHNTVSTSDFILILLFIFIAVSSGICVRNIYF